MFKEQKMNLAMIMVSAFSQAIFHNARLQADAQAQFCNSPRNHDGSKKGYHHSHNEAGAKLARLAINQACTVRSATRLAE